MPNPYLTQMINFINDSDLTEKQRVNKVCIAFAAWASEARTSDTQLSANEQLKELDIMSLEKVNALLHSAAASMNIANMFSDSSFADSSLEKFNRMTEHHSMDVIAESAVSASPPNKPLPKPPTRLASTAASSSSLFGIHPTVATSSASNGLPPIQKRR